jgi:D-amino peptidase
VRVFLSSDMEGTAGVVDWSQCRIGQPQYEHYRGLLQREVNAAIEGAQVSGASEFLVNDSHSTMQNMRPAELAGRARYLSGRHKPLYMMQGLDASFDAVFFVSYHGSMSSLSPLSHTYNPLAVAEVTLNGAVVGEGGINALVALAHRVPVVLVTGDDVTAAETRRVCPTVRTAVVKRAVSRFAADSMHPDDACDLIRAEAQQAIGGLGAAALPAIELPAVLRVRWRNADLAETATWISGVERIDATTVEMADEDPLQLFRRFISTVMLTREIAE